MARATLDVNLLVSAAIMPRGVPYQVLLAWQARRFTAISSAHVIDQLTLKLRSDRIGRLYGITTADIRALTNLLRNDAVVVDVPPEEVLPITGDSEDDAVLATARLGQSDYLVIGDRGLLARSPYEGIAIVSPRAFLDLLDADDS